MSKDLSPRPLYYLECEYGPGLLNNEYQIKFKSVENSQNQAIVNKLDVKIINDKEGLAKIVVLEFEEDRVLFKINDVSEGRLLEFYTPKSEIIENPAIADVLK